MGIGGVGVDAGTTAVLLSAGASADAARAANARGADVTAASAVVVIRLEISTGRTTESLPGGGAGTNA
jgi:hypothetical protein